MLSLSILSSLALFLVGASAAPTLQKRAPTFNYNDEKVRGVNIGGWLVLEPWITPSLFENVNDPNVVDEYLLSQKLGGNAKSVLKAHWEKFIGPSDFQQIANAGLNHVRIPIGYWAVAKLEGDPYVDGQIEYLDKAVKWATDARLKVMIDLHGAPGSQNGFDNSGKRGSVDWQRVDMGAKQTIKAIKILAERYANKVASIELLNEPMGSNNALDMGQVKKFYYDGWGSVRDFNKETAIVIHDAFQDVQSYWNGFMNQGVNNVILDTHIYQIFSPDQVARSPADHVKAACATAPKLAGTDKWTIVGEWTGAQTDCAKWLNGFQKGARYDGSFEGSFHVGSCDGKRTGTVANLPADDKKNIRSFIEAQLDAYESHTGWIFWTWTTESAPEWDMKQLLANGLFPQPLTARQFGKQCA